MGKKLISIQSERENRSRKPQKESFFTFMADLAANVEEALDTPEVKNPLGVDAALDRSTRASERFDRHWANKVRRAERREEILGDIQDFFDGIARDAERKKEDRKNAQHAMNRAKIAAREAYATNRRPKTKKGRR